MRFVFLLYNIYLFGVQVDSFRAVGYGNSRLLSTTLASKNKLAATGNSGADHKHFVYNFFRDDLSRRYLKFKFDEKSLNYSRSKDGTHVYGLKNIKFSNIEQFLADMHGIMIAFRDIIVERPDLHDLSWKQLARWKRKIRLGLNYIFKRADNTLDLTTPPVASPLVKSYASYLRNISKVSIPKLYSHYFHFFHGVVGQEPCKQLEDILSKKYADGVDFDMFKSYNAFRHEFMEYSQYHANKCILTGDGFGEEWTDEMKQECLDESCTCRHYMLSLLSHLIPTSAVALDPRAREVDKLH